MILMRSMYGYLGPPCCTETWKAQKLRAQVVEAVSDTGLNTAGTVAATDTAVGGGGGGGVRVHVRGKLGYSRSATKLSSSGWFTTAASPMRNTVSTGHLQESLAPQFARPCRTHMGTAPCDYLDVLASLCMVLPPRRIYSLPPRIRLMHIASTIKSTLQPP